jgi:3D (Asp-Asp-Asp) domain-containing protein
MNKNKNIIMIVFMVFFLITMLSVIKLKHEKEEIMKQKAELETIIQDLQNDKVDLKNTVLKLQEEVQSKQELIDAQKKRTVVSPTRGQSSRTYIFTATAYDLSFASCGKEPSHPQYGISVSGVDLKGKSLDDRFIAVDPKVIKLGNVVYIEFFEPYQHLTGYYTAVDTGGAIKGNKVDIFFGSGDVSQAVKNFGRRKVKITY